MFDSLYNEVGLHLKSEGIRHFLALVTDKDELSLEKIFRLHNICRNYVDSIESEFF